MTKEDFIGLYEANNVLGQTITGLREKIQSLEEGNIRMKKEVYDYQERLKYAEQFIPQVAEAGKGDSKQG